METHPVENIESARKKGRNENTWKRSREKRQRYGASGPHKKIVCNHGKKGKSYNCKDITYADQEQFFKRFYSFSKKSSEIKIKKDSFILKFTETFAPKKSRPKDNTRGQNKLTANYFIYKKSSKEKVRVCKKAFLDTLRISHNRVNGVISRNFESCEMPEEKRGGNRKEILFSEKKSSVKAFIKRFRVIESHYCRSKSGRQYVNSNLNIKKMWRMYQSETEPGKQVKESYFRFIFNRFFNIGFGYLRTDECSNCLSLDEKMKNCTDPEGKGKLMAEKRVHKLKAKAFYNILKEESSTLITISFDCQKNQVIPKVPDQSAFYSRQLYKYNLTAVVGSSISKQTKDNVFIYDWNESDYPKSSNEIASAVYDCLNTISIPDTVKTVRLASDGCGGQNKNYYMMSMVAFWLLKKAPETVTTVEYIFPMVGHSFLPSDRVFGRIEKDVKKEAIIVNPEEYTQIFSRHGTTISLVGKNYDWKKTFEPTVLQPGKWHFKLNPCKRFYFRRTSKRHDVTVKGEVHYRSNFGKFKRFCKNHVKFQNIGMPELIAPSPSMVSTAKAKDVDKLLGKHFGEEWKTLESLAYYKAILEGPTSETTDTANAVCTHDEESDLIV